MYRFFIFVLLAASRQAAAQEPRAGLYEWRWALFHPIAAIQVKLITKQCAVLCKESPVYPELDNFDNGGQADAFRHCFYMAAYSQKIKIRKLRKLGVAHEKSNHRQFLRSKYEEGELPDSLSSVMDLKNNELGFKTGSENKTLSLEALKRLCVQEIRSGKAVIVKRNKAGHYLDCKGKEIDLKIYLHQWNIPKCLVKSDKRD